MKYSIPFTGNKERQRIRKWAGMTSGASILKKSGDWEIAGNTNTFEVTEHYVVEVKTKKAEMLLKLQFGNAKKYIEQNGVLDNWGDWYEFKNRRF